MDLNEYQRLAIRTAKQFPTLAANLNHAALGMCTETGEFTTNVKRIAIYGKEMTREMRANMIEEVGDAMWYVALAAESLGTTLDDICRGNIAKLQQRYPDKYSDQAAEARADKAGADARNS